MYVPYWHAKPARETHFPIIEILVVQAFLVCAGCIAPVPLVLVVRGHMPLCRAHFGIFPCLLCGLDPFPSPDWFVADRVAVQHSLSLNMVKCPLLELVGKGGALLTLCVVGGRW